MTVCVVAQLKFSIRAGAAPDVRAGASTRS